MSNMKIVRVREFVRDIVLKCRYFVFVHVYKMNIDPTARIAWGARLDKASPKSIHIGKESYVASGAVILAHDFSRRIDRDTYIGERCFIGANAIVMPGVHIGDEVIVGSGAVVTQSPPPKCIVVGNPAKVLREGISTGRYGYIKTEEECRAESDK